ncbi:hypothetical protein [Catelliglobosispora koreensis]|uniref:hypothetical protein n=1 Tax=Catelliglobosispora koreensis TaxID=129052 RepID=UPI00037A0C0A|nr:hypothetical protein [Catelliglobosispora koreensis]
MTAVLITRLDEVALAGLTIGGDTMILSPDDLERALAAIGEVRSCWLYPVPRQLWAAVHRALETPS